MNDQKTVKNAQVAGLSPEARGLYAKLSKEWRIVDASGLLVLLTAMQALDRLRQAQALLARDGIVMPDRFGQQKPHPASQIEREARGGLLQALRALNLDLESLEGDGDAA
ncbi:MAG: hypothetical protein ABI972_26780 [Acidobacteriota bacterium]